jgi:hypothetical protein
MQFLPEIFQATDFQQLIAYEGFVEDIVKSSIANFDLRKMGRS